MHIYGTCGHEKLIARILLDNKEPISGFIDDRPASSTLMGIPVFHSNELKNLKARRIVLGIDNNKTRKKSDDLWGRRGWSPHLFCIDNLSST